MTDSLVAVPSAEEVEQYGVSSGAGDAGIPLIADDEAVCRVRVLETGSGAYWAQGDVDTHVLYAKQHGLLDTWLVPREAWRAQTAPPAATATSAPQRWAAAPAAMLPKGIKPNVVSVSTLRTRPRISSGA